MYLVKMNDLGNQRLKFRCNHPIIEGLSFDPCQHLDGKNNVKLMESIRSLHAKRGLVVYLQPALELQGERERES